MNVEAFWKGINLGENHKKAVCEEVFEYEECQRLYDLYQLDHNLFFDTVLKKEKYELWFLWLYSHMACDAYKVYQEKKIPDKIFWNTFQDIRLWCENA